MLRLAIVSFLAVGCLPQTSYRAAPSAAGDSLNRSTATTTTTSTSSTTSTTPTTLLDGTDGTRGTGGASGTQQLSCSGRNYILSVPNGLDANQPVPLIAFFHGAGDDYQNFANGVNVLGWNTLATSQKFITMVPEHKNPNRPSFLYFSGGAVDLVATQREASSVYDCIIQHVGGLYNISRSRIHWLGFSEGASFASVAASSMSDKLKTVVAYAGSMPRENPVRRIPLSFVVGTADRFYEYVAEDSQTWLDAGHVVRREYVPAVGHSFRDLNRTVDSLAVWTWMKSQ